MAVDTPIFNMASGGDEISEEFSDDEVEMTAADVLQKIEEVNQRESCLLLPVYTCLLQLFKAPL